MRVHYNVNCFSFLFVLGLVVVCAFFFFALLAGWFTDHSPWMCNVCMMCRWRRSYCCFLFIYEVFTDFDFIHWIYMFITALCTLICLSNDVPCFHFHDISHTLLVLANCCCWCCYSGLFICLLNSISLDVTFVRRWPQNTIEYHSYIFSILILKRQSQSLGIRKLMRHFMVIHCT